MRWLLIMLAVGAAGTAGYFGLFVKNSFTSYSNEQLDLLEREIAVELEQHRAAPTRKPRPNEARTEQQVWAEDRQQLVLEERRRRLFFILALGVAGASAVGAFLARGGSSSAPRLRTSSDEESRLVAVVGDPAVLREGARQKAAALLGVAPEAPPAVIEAALQAQLQQRDPAMLTGLAPNLKQLVMEQREELTRARDLLLNKPGPQPGTPGGKS